MKFINSADISMFRDNGGGGTSTLTVSGGTGEDIVVDAGVSYENYCTFSYCRKYAIYN